MPTGDARHTKVRIPPPVHVNGRDRAMAAIWSDAYLFSPSGFET